MGAPWLVLPMLLSQQVMLLDARFTFTSDNSAMNRPYGISDSLKGSHAMLPVDPGLPTNLLSPVDYKDGTYYLVIDVFSKPSTLGLHPGWCALQGYNYMCKGAWTGNELSTTGRFVDESNYSQLYISGTMDWTQPFTVAQIGMRDPNQVKTDIGQGFLYEPDYSMYYPIDMHARVYFVAPGATFVPPRLDTPDAGAPIVDAGGVSAEVEPVLALEDLVLPTPGPPAVVDTAPPPEPAPPEQVVGGMSCSATADGSAALLAFALLRRFRHQRRHQLGGR
jgi:hypothetical protein